MKRLLIIGLTFSSLSFGSTALAQDRGFLLDVDPIDINRHIGAFTAADLAVGERGFVYYGYFCAVDGTLSFPSGANLSDVADVQEPEKIYVVIKRQPGNSISIEVDFASFRDREPNFDYYNILLAIFSPPNCDVKDAQNWPHNVTPTYFAVTTVNNMQKASDVFGLLAQ